MPLINDLNNVLELIGHQHVVVVDRACHIATLQLNRQRVHTSPGVSMFCSPKSIEVWFDKYYPINDKFKVCVDETNNIGYIRLREGLTDAQAT